MRSSASALRVEVLWFGPVKAQAKVANGTVIGTVTESPGAALPGVKIVVHNQATSISRELRTDAADRYAAPTLGLGS